MPNSRKRHKGQDEAKPVFAKDPGCGESPSLRQNTAKFVKPSNEKHTVIGRNLTPGPIMFSDETAKNKTETDTDTKYQLLED